MNKTVHSIPLDLIDVGERLRPVDPDYVALIAASMAERGLDTPVTVTAADATTGRHRLIAGGHRIAAARALGWPKIDALLSDANELQARLLEIDENLIRRELSALDRAVFLAERQAVYLAMHPETGHGKARKNKGEEKTTSLSSFAQATAAKLGLDERSIQRAIKRAALEPDIRRLLTGHPVADSGAELDKLLSLTPEGRRQAVAALTRAETPARNISAAIAEFTGPARASKAAEAQRQLSALLGAWRKAGKKARGEFLDFLASEGEIGERPAKKPAEAR